MIIVVDAYNVVKQIVNKKEITDSERTEFLNQMQNYAHQKGHSIIIVFDGGPDQWPSQETIGELSVVYSGYQDDADTYIKDYLAKNKGKDLLLVSSDRELRDTADRLHIPWIDAVSFYRLVQERVREEPKRSKIRGQGPVVKTTTTHEPELDRLMQEATKYVEHKAEDKTPARQTSKEKVPKKKRILMRKINKL
jgi:predicted RNA-binding protein with PIN domain